MAYTLVVTALNSSESTVVVPVKRNLPGFLDADGRTLRPTGSVSLTSIGTTSQPYIKDFALPPGARLLAIQTFSLLARPVGYTVNWRLGDVGVATLDVR